MIGLYYKEGIKWIKWTSKYDYLVTKSKIVYYFGKVPENIKNDYLTDEGVELTRFFIQRLRDGEFYFRVEVKKGLQKCYRFYLGFDSTNLYNFLEKCSMHKIKYIESYWFKHIVEGVVRHYISEGDAIAGMLLENVPFKLINHSTGIEVDIDISDSYLPIAWDSVKWVMRGRKWIESVTWANRKIIMINDLPIEETRPTPHL
jgi:hypothetical protein